MAIHIIGKPIKALEIRRETIDYVIILVRKVGYVLLILLVTFSIKAKLSKYAFFEHAEPCKPGNLG